jgi:hypothetical protein
VNLAGGTSSTTGIASGGFQNVYGGSSDAFLVKFSGDGARQWATYYGGPVSEMGNMCTTDKTGNIYLVGTTDSKTDIASGGFQNTFKGQEDAFLVKFNSNGMRQWATYYGGKDYDYGYACVIDKFGNVYLARATDSKSGIAAKGFQNVLGGGFDGFLVKFDSSGTKRIWATYYGGLFNDYDEGELYHVPARAFCIVDSNSNVYLSGNTQSDSGIASGGFQNTYGGGSKDAFLVKFNNNGIRQADNEKYLNELSYQVIGCAIEVHNNSVLVYWKAFMKNVF